MTKATQVLSPAPHDPIAPPGPGPCNIWKAPDPFQMWPHSYSTHRLGAGGNGRGVAGVWDASWPLVALGDRALGGWGPLWAQGSGV